MATEVHSIILNAAELHNVSGHGKIITLEVTMRESNGGGKEGERRERESKLEGKGIMLTKRSLTFNFVTGYLREGSSKMTI